MIVKLVIVENLSMEALPFSIACSDFHRRNGDAWRRARGQGPVPQPGYNGRRRVQHPDEGQSLLHRSLRDR